MQHSFLDKLIGASFAAGIRGVKQGPDGAQSGWVFRHFLWMGPPDTWVWTVPSPTQYTLTREQGPAPFCLHAQTSLSICPCPVRNPHKLPGWWCSTQQAMQQAAGSFRCHYAWTSSMRAPKHDVAGVWRRVGVPARMDGARTSSYMTECHSWGGGGVRHQHGKSLQVWVHWTELLAWGEGDACCLCHVSHPWEWTEEEGRTDRERKGRILRCDFSPGKLSRPAADPLGTVLCAFTMNILKRPLVEFFCYFAMSTDMVLWSGKWGPALTKLLYPPMRRSESDALGKVKGPRA